MKTFKMTLEFDNKEAAENFSAHWIDGGADGGGNIDWDTNIWTDDYIRIEGTGHLVDGDDYQEYTPERDIVILTRRLERAKERIKERQIMLEFIEDAKKLVDKLKK